MSKLRMVIIAGTAGLAGALLASARQQADGERLFRDVLSVVSNKYMSPLNQSELLGKAAVGLLDQLDDPYAHLYPPSEQDQFAQDHQGNYGGVGMTIEDRDGVHTVVRVFHNTPAEGVGFQEGDRITAVNDEVVHGWPIEKVTGRIKGPPGSKVAIEYSRGTTESIKSTVTRAVVSIPMVPYTTNIDGVGYIPLVQFGETSSDEVEAALKKLKQQGAKSFVLDLRGNGGGMLNEAVEIADLFLPAGRTVVVQRERSDKPTRPHEDMTYKAQDNEDQGTAPVVILVDQLSASASEIVAGALQDHDRALILGGETYGKGVVQTVYRVGGNNLLKLTTGEWLTPAGRSIHRKREKVNGNWTVVTDSADAAREFFSTAGRKLKGHGGIDPDLVVRNDTLTMAERMFLDAVRPQSSDFYLVYTGYAAELKDQVRPGFAMQKQWLDELFARLQTRGVKVTRAQYDGASEYISDLLALRIARTAFGDSEAKKQFAAKDPQLTAALQLLRAHHTQKDLITAAVRRGDP